MDGGQGMGCIARAPLIIMQFTISHRNGDECILSMATPRWQRKKQNVYQNTTGSCLLGKHVMARVQWLLCMQQASPNHNLEECW